MEYPSGWTLTDVGAVFVGLAGLTATWGGLHTGPIQLVDACLAIGSALVVVDAVVTRVRLSRLLPRWALVGGWAILLITASSVLLPVSPGFVSGRLVVDISPFVTQVSDRTPVWLKGSQWLIAAVVLLIVFHLIALRSVSRLRWICFMWMWSACVSSAVALTDFLGITNVSEGLLGFENFEGRQSGLSTHPNNLGVACAMAIPIAVMLMLRWRALGLIAAATLIGGAIVSGSRAGQVAVVVVLLAAITLQTRGRKTIPWFAGAALGILVLVGLVSPAWIPAAEPTSIFRFSSSNSNAAESDAGREALAHQALLDFAHRPINGIGLDYVVTAHSVYLQVFAAGGLILGAGMLVYLFGALVSGLRLKSLFNSLPFFLTLSHIAWLGSGAVSNQLTDRYLYFPAACIAALELIRRTAPAEPRESSEAVVVQRADKHRPAADTAAPARLESATPAWMSVDTMVIRVWQQAFHQHGDKE